MVGEYQVADPAVQASVDKMHHQLDSKKNTAEGQLIGHKAGLSGKEHSDLHRMLLTLQQGLRVSTVEGDSPAHGLDALTQRINKQNETVRG